ncbi:hypothetical protein LSTR_LSTR009942 [Laodelphax striatellus]|uniref:MYM-type domain-containing protein n=1 Tax=Laodelphax striatellus TaxID=195883 RepID=A0A482XIR1_LAOST|nr:hypothetical protein LSTR_LSTR009942 [Laodelphax striatellus]
MLYLVVFLGCFEALSCKGACCHCDNVIRGTPVRLEYPDAPAKSFCSTTCLTKHQKKESVEQNGQCKSYFCLFSPYPPVPLSQLFDWDAYLSETNSFAAPPEYFKQLSTSLSPVNEFKMGMKWRRWTPHLTSTCHTSVVWACWTATLRLRLDAATTRNDFWRLVRLQRNYTGRPLQQQWRHAAASAHGFRMNASSMADVPR